MSKYWIKQVLGFVFFGLALVCLKVDFANLAWYQCFAGGLGLGMVINMWGEANNGV